MGATEVHQVSLQERVAARFDTLTATERRVAQYFSEHPQEVAFASAEELARAVGTSDASIVRTAKSLGFEGLPGLKRVLQTHLETLLTPANRLHNSLDAMPDGPAGVLASTLAERTDLLSDAQRTLDPATFAEAVALICQARETLVCGIAALGGIAEDFALRLTRIGRRARTATATGFRLADELLPLTADDTVVVIAHNRLSREVRVTLSHANRVGARVVLLTDTLGEMLRDRSDVVLSAPIGRPAMFSSHSTTLVALEALVLAVADADRDHALRAITEMNRLRELLDGHPVDVEDLQKRSRAARRSPNGRGSSNGTGSSNGKGKSTARSSRRRD